MGSPDGSCQLTRLDTFPAISSGGQSCANWNCVRQTTNFQHNGPITDVSSSQMSCYEINPGRGPSGVLSVQAGGSVGMCHGSSQPSSATRHSPLYSLHLQPCNLPPGPRHCLPGQGPIRPERIELEPQRSRVVQDLAGQRHHQLQWHQMAQRRYVHAQTRGYGREADTSQAPAPSACPSPVASRTATTCCGSSTRVSTAPRAPAALRSSTFPRAD